jgi:glycosyltransferase involved in cell wall biosynthesis
VPNGANNQTGSTVRGSICVLVPALNEVENIRPTVEILIRALKETTDDFEIIVVDDGSADGTAEAADQLTVEFPQVRVFHNASNRGIGYAYKIGYEQARCHHFVYIPGDNTWPYESCRQLFAHVGQADIVTSYPLNPHIRPLGRRLLSSFYTGCLNLLFWRKLHYYNGLNIYPLSFLRAQPDLTFGFGFQAQTLLRALAAGLTYVEVGLAISERAAGSSKAVTLRSVLGVAMTILGLAWELRMRRWRKPTRNF